MGALLQVAGAGLVLAIWVWLLVVPMRREHDHVADWAADPGGGDQHEMWSHWTDGRFGGPVRWWYGPLTRRRRQLLLGTVFATFAAFFLAIAFKGLFIRLLTLTIVMLAIHLGFASYHGARLVNARRASAIARAKERVSAKVSFAPTDLAASTEAVDTVTVHRPDAEGESVGVSTLVSDLIDEAWSAEVDTPSFDGRSSESAGSGGPPPPSSDSARPSGDDGEASDASRDRSDTLKPEPLFTKAAERGPSRRRRARPIHIESQLDTEATTARAASDA